MEKSALKCCRSSAKLSCFSATPTCCPPLPGADQWLSYSPLSSQLLLKRITCIFPNSEWFDQRILVQDDVPDEGYHKTDELDFNYVQSQGVSPSELNKKLSHLLIEQQENQIADLEAELQLAQSRLNEKEAELQALKDCVRSLTELSLSTVSGMTFLSCYFSFWSHFPYRLLSQKLPLFYIIFVKSGFIGFMHHRNRIF